MSEQQFHADVMAELEQEFYGSSPPIQATHSLRQEPIMNINDLSNSKYLKGKDVPAPALVTIKSIEVHNVAKETEPKQERPIVTFRELDKPMVFNQTNLKRCAKALGSEETDDWIGKKVVIYFDEDVEFGGEIVGGLRVRKVAGKAAKETSRETPKSSPTPEFEEAAGDITDVPW